MPSTEEIATAAAALSESLGVKVLTSLPPPEVATDEPDDLAGVYELTATQWDEPFIVLLPHPVTGVLVQTDHFKRHHRGDLVSLTHAEAYRLLNAEAVAVPGLRAARTAQRLEAMVELQRRELDTATKRKKDAAELLGDVELTDQQRALLELELNGGGRA